MEAESELERMKLELEEKSRLLEEALERERNRTKALSGEKYYVYLEDEIEFNKTGPEVARRYQRMADRIRGVRPPRCSSTLFMMDSWKASVETFLTHYVYHPEPAKLS